MSSGTARVGAALVAAGLFASGPTVGGEVSLESGVIFGTSCARCHEGECSGRLTFDLGAGDAAGHVRRHAGPVSDASVQELVALLARMKKDCTWPPFEAPAPVDGVWSPDLLARLCTSSRRRCFVPLGTLEPGRYAVEVVFDGEPHVHAEIVTRSFEILLDSPLTIAAGRSTAAFASSAAGAAFLRLVAEEPMVVKRLSLERHPAPGSSCAETRTRVAQNAASAGTPRRAQASQTPVVGESEAKLRVVTCR